MGDSEATRRYGLPSVPLRNVPRLSWFEGDQPRSRRLTQRVIVGSAPDSDVVIVDPYVSRVHAELELRDDGTWVRDLGSQNGTFVSGLMVSAARVDGRAQLRVGHTDLLLSYEEHDGEPVALWPGQSYGRLLGTSVVMRELFATLDRVAKTDASVLLQGETGTGKEVVAQSLHEASPRCSGPFVVVDCGALHESVLDAELFGHAKGAFTGAVAARAGAFEAASGGTIFLDEIGELPLAVQPKLLRALEASEVRRVGETHYRKVDVRVVAATHRHLAGMVGRGEFREDLYFRLGVVFLRVPSLREHREDVPMLVEHFIGSHAGPLFTTADLERLAERTWRGNVRELRNLVTRARSLGVTAALTMTEDERAMFADAPPSSPGIPPLDPPSTEMAATPPSDVMTTDYRSFRVTWTERGDREYLVALLQRNGRNVSAAAREAGLSRTYLHRLLQKYGI